MICSPPSEIAFSQVREDPTIELRVIEHLAAKQGHPLRVLLIASGGCTALSLLSSSAVAQVEAVDLNPAQLHLVELRRQALLYLSLDNQLKLIGADLTATEDDRISIYAQLRSQLPETTRVFWDARIAQIGFGVNRVGRFEQLFRELSAHFAADGIDALTSPENAIAHPRWRTIFETVFERGKLARTFGEAAVNYSMERSFGEHFADMFAIALQRFVAKGNYFLTQVWGDRYADGVDGVPLYLQPSVQAKIRSLGTNRLRLHQGAFVEVMPQLAKENKFDLIQFSNISDWMPLSDLHAMLTSAVSCLQPGGMLIGRRLNGDLDLAAVMGDFVLVDRQFSAELLTSDRSFFYREVVVGVKE
ncbi:DUF3419 family protein [Aerosakkonema sp. BLCC-F183]|uniref:DUF3419 family protein n=1 Tax=Aerosakkonema sp. BLCC-F183 TaxID=3342834 RepID=UPI0035BB1472